MKIDEKENDRRRLFTHIANFDQKAGWFARFFNGVAKIEPISLSNFIFFYNFPPLPLLPPHPFAVPSVRQLLCCFFFKSSGILILPNQSQTKNRPDARKGSGLLKIYTISMRIVALYFPSAVVARTVEYPDSMPVNTPLPSTEPYRLPR